MSLTRRPANLETPSLATRPVWAAGELITEYNGNFEKFVSVKDMSKQEGILFRHLLRLILLIREFRPLAPPDLDLAAWQYDPDELVDPLTASCRAVDPTSTDMALVTIEEEAEEEKEFGAGVFE